jgi:hypothetical protein
MRLSIYAQTSITWPLYKSAANIGTDFFIAGKIKTPDTAGNKKDKIRKAIDVLFNCNVSIYRTALILVSSSSLRVM